MQQIDLPYGDHFLSLEYDPRQFILLNQPFSEPAPLNDVQIGDALDSPIASRPLAELLNQGQSVLIVVSDATRATGSAQIINLLVRRLIENGIAPQDIAIIFATGIHRAVTPEERRELLTPFIVQRIRIFDHDAADVNQLANYGITKRGTKVELNRALCEFDHTIITGAIGFHYFAGFTGGRKSICPGLASADTIRETHMLALDPQTGKRRGGVGTGLLEGNAVHEECDEIAGLVKPAFAISSVVDNRGRAVKIYAGDWREAHRVGCLEYLVDHSVGIPEKRELVVVSCGGLPYDINLIQAHKALEMAATACVDGGTIILVAECREGLGRRDFLKWFDGNSSDSLAGRLRDEYEVNGQTAWSLLSKAERFRVFMISALPDAQVEQMKMTAKKTLAHALADLEKVNGYVMPHGAALLPLTGNE
jgi:nickel-dependent lactate racemase